MSDKADNRQLQLDTAAQ